jgi:hypothetical protein
VTSTLFHHCNTSHVYLLTAQFMTTCFSADAAQVTQLAEQRVEMEDLGSSSACWSSHAREELLQLNVCPQEFARTRQVCSLWLRCFLPRSRDAASLI